MCGNVIFCSTDYRNDASFSCCKNCWSPSHTYVYALRFRMMVWNEMYWVYSEQQFDTLENSQPCCESRWLHALHRHSKGLASRDRWQQGGRWSWSVHPTCKWRRRVNPSLHTNSAVYFVKSIFDGFAGSPPKKTTLTEEF